MVQQSLHIQFLLKILRSLLNTQNLIISYIYIYFYYYILNVRYNKIYYIHIYIFKVNTELNL